MKRISPFLISFFILSILACGLFGSSSLTIVKDEPPRVMGMKGSADIGMVKVL